MLSGRQKQNMRYKRKVLTRLKGLLEILGLGMTEKSVNDSKFSKNKKHLKNVGPIRHCEPLHAHSPGVATGTVARRLRIDVHDDNDDNDNNV